MGIYAPEIYELIRDGVNLFDFDYTTSYPDGAESLQARWTMYYNRHEIGFETVGAFKERLRSVWCLKIPQYNQLWDEAGIITDWTSNRVRKGTSVNIVNAQPVNDTDFNSRHATSIVRDTADDTERTVPYYQVMREYGEKFYQIDIEFFKEFDYLFMQIYN